MHTAEATHDESEATPLQSCEAPGEREDERAREGWRERGRDRDKNSSNVGMSETEGEGKTSLEGRRTESGAGGKVLFFRLKRKAGGKSM